MISRTVRPLLLAAGLAALGAGTPATAESLTDALIQAYRTSPVLEANRAALRALDENVPQAKADRRPQVGAGITGDAGTNVEAFEDQTYALQAALNASLLVFDSGQTKAAIESARYSVAAGRADLLDVEQLVLFNAVQAYVDVLRDQEFVRLAQTDVDRLGETLRATRNRFDVGEVTRTDVSQAESRLAESRSTLAATEGQLQISREAYLAAVGSLPRDLERAPPLPELPASEEAATAIGLRRNPQITSAQFAERSAVYDVDRAIAAKRPTVSLNGSAGIQRSNQFQGDQEFWDGNTFGAIGIEGTMPLYTGGRNDSLVRQAQAILDQRRNEVQDAARTVVEQVSAAWTNLRVARASIIARREQAEAARLAAEGVAEEARLGARTTLDVLDADQERLQAEAEIVQARRDEYVAAYGLLQAMGLLTVAHLNLGIETYDPDVYFRRVQNAPVGGYDTSAVDRIRARWER